MIPRKRVLVASATLFALSILLLAIALPPRPRSSLAVPDPGPAPRATARGALHIHTNRSDGTGSVDEVAAAAARAGLQFIILTEHGDGTRPPLAPAVRHGVLVLDGVEISTAGGHYVALGLPAAPYRLSGEPRDVVEDVHRLGGFGIAAHPDSSKTSLRWTGWDAPIDGLEWLNADSEWRDEGRVALLRALLTYPWRPSETLGALVNHADTMLARWDELAQARRIIGVAGADAHARIGFRERGDLYRGRVLARAPSYEAQFRTFSLHVELDAPLTSMASSPGGGGTEASSPSPTRNASAERAAGAPGSAVAPGATDVRNATAAAGADAAPDKAAAPGATALPDAPAARDAEAVLRAIRGGRVYTTLDALAMPGVVDFEATSNGRRARMGDFLAPDGAIEWQASAAAPAGATLRLVCDGKVVVEASASTRLRHRHATDARPAACRLEGGWTEGERRIAWLVTNPIYLRAQDAAALPPPGAAAPAVERLPDTFSAPDAWGLETDPSSKGAWTREAGGITFTYELKAGVRVSQYVALVARGVSPIARATRVSFRAHADKPMRMFVQAREPGGGGARWVRSVYLDTGPRELSVRFDDMRPVWPAPPHPPLDRVHALLFVVDTEHTRPGISGTIRLADVRLERE